VTQGTGNDILVRKCSPQGALIWTRTQDAGGHDSAFGVASDNQGNTFVAGVITPGTVAQVSKYAAAGTMLWSRTYDAGAHQVFRKIVTDNAGNAIAVGTRSGNVLLAKYTSSGDPAWIRSHDFGSIDDNGLDVALSGDDIVVSGVTSASTWLVLTAKLDADGQLIWSRTYSGGVNEYGIAIAVDSQRNVITAGKTWPPGSDGDDALVLKYDAAGNLLWTDVFDGGSTDEAFGVAVDHLDNILVAGATYRGTNRQAFVRKYTADGMVLWSKPWGHASDDWAYGIALDPGGNAFVTGCTVEANVTHEWVAKLAP
jgi:hypothetical protein